jgi:hypothetical protein
MESLNFMGTLVQASVGYAAVSPEEKPTQAEKLEWAVAISS